MTLRIDRRNSTPPVESIRPRVYGARQVSKSRTGDYLLARTPGTSTAHRDRSARAPLRPSEGLAVAFPSSLKPCPDDRSAPLNVRGCNKCGGTRMASRQTWGPAYGPAVPNRHATEGLGRHITDGQPTRGEEARVNLPAAPPQNVDAEQRVLGTLIVFYKPQLVHVVQAAGLKWSDFYRPTNVIVYRAILRMHKGGEHVDHLTLTHFLRCQRHDTAGTWLAAAGGEAHLELLACSATVNGLRECARIVAENGRWRRWLDATFTALESIYARDEDGFWAALARVREDVMPGEPLKVIEGGEPGEKAA